MTVFATGETATSGVPMTRYSTNGNGSEEHLELVR
jgi:hypothetical protein